MRKLLLASLIAIVPAVVSAGAVDVVCFDRALPQNVVNFDGVFRYQMDGTMLTTFAKDGTPLYYRVPDNYLCVIKENKKDDGQEPTVRSNVYPATGRTGWRYPSVPEFQPSTDQFPD